jgi:hypothetical protein
MPISGQEIIRLVKKAVEVENRNSSVPGDHAIAGALIVSALRDVSSEEIRKALINET